MSDQILNNEVVLSVRGLKQYFKMGSSQLKAVDDVSFDVHRGEVFGIVGESGCGKTTTGRSIIGLYDITGGDVFLEDKLVNTGVPGRKAEIREARKAGHTELAQRLANERKEAIAAVKANRKELYKNIQMIFQDPISSLDPRMTVREIIAEGLKIQGERNKDVIEKKVREVLDYVRLVPEHANRYPHEFSGGQRQRIGIARAIVMQPKIIIADEPVSALDVSIQAQIINLLNDLRRDMGMTVIFIAHDLSVVKYFSNRIAVMHFGKIVELSESDELFAHPFHPYTKALLSSIPTPDPRVERARRRVAYVPELAHDYSKEKPTLQEIRPGHFVLANSEEIKRYLEEDQAREAKN